MRDFNFRFRRGRWKDFLLWAMYLAGGSLVFMMTVGTFLALAEYTIMPTKELSQHEIEMLTALGIGLFGGAWSVAARDEFNSLDRKVRCISHEA